MYGDSVASDGGVVSTSHVGFDAVAGAGGGRKSDRGVRRGSSKSKARCCYTFGIFDVAGTAGFLRAWRFGMTCGLVDR